MKKYLFIPLAALLLTGCQSNEVETKTIVPVRFSDGIKFAPGNTNQTFQLTATIEPEYAYNKQIEWSIEWDTSEANSTDNDEFKVGKIVTDYVKLTVNSTDPTIANIDFVKPFGSQIVVKATSVQDPDIYAKCIINYTKRLNVMNHNATEFTAVDGDVFTNPITYHEGVGTLPYLGAKEITYKYGKHFYWQAPQYNSGLPTKATEVINVSGGGYTSNLFVSMPLKMSLVNTKELNLKEASRIFGGAGAGLFFLETLYYAISNIKASGTRNGADLYFPYTAYIDGQQIGAYNNSHKTVIEDGVTYGLAKINIAGLDIQSQMNIALNETNITY